VARRITTARWLLCASPDYLARAGTPKTPQDLHAHRCLNFLPGSFRSRWPLKEKDQITTHEPKALAAANNGDMLCTLAMMGLGLARLADYHIDAELKAGQLVAVLDDYALDREPIYAVFASKRHLSPRVRSFLDHATQVFGDS
jgi:DNA-binding transcriptional LysR family regulator